MIAGAAALLAVVFAGTSGFAAALVIFGEALSVFPADPEFMVFALAFDAAVPASAEVATAGSACGCESPAGFAGCWAPSFFAVADSDFPAGVDGIIDSILSFSISSYPYSVLTLNMLSS